MTRVRMADERVYHGDGEDSGEAFADVIARELQVWPNVYRVSWDAERAEYVTERTST